MSVSEDSKVWKASHANGKEAPALGNHSVQQKKEDKTATSTKKQTT